MDNIYLVLGSSFIIFYFFFIFVSMKKGEAKQQEERILREKITCLVELSKATMNFTEEDRKYILDKIDPANDEPIQKQGLS